MKTRDLSIITSDIILNEKGNNIEKVELLLKTPPGRKFEAHYLFSKNLAAEFRLQASDGSAYADGKCFCALTVSGDESVKLTVTPLDEKHGQEQLTATLKKLAEEQSIKGITDFYDRVRVLDLAKQKGFKREQAYKDKQQSAKASNIEVASHPTPKTESAPDPVVVHETNSPIKILISPASNNQAINKMRTVQEKNIQAQVNEDQKKMGHSLDALENYIRALDKHVKFLTQPQPTKKSSSLLLWGKNKEKADNKKINEAQHKKQQLKEQQTFLSEAIYLYCATIQKGNAFFFERAEMFLNEICPKDANGFMSVICGEKVRDLSDLRKLPNLAEVCRQVQQTMSPGNDFEQTLIKHFNLDNASLEQPSKESELFTELTQNSGFIYRK